MNITLTYSFPAHLPLPHIDFGGGPASSNLIADRSFARIARRQRFTHPYQVINVRWILKPVLYNDFQTFYRDTIHNGTASFSMELRYPKQSALTSWQVRFVGELTSHYEEGMWMIEASLFLHRRIEIVEPIPPIDPGAGASGSSGGGSGEALLPGEYGGNTCEGAAIGLTIGSAYVWGWGAESDPHAILSTPYWTTYKALFNNEKAIAIDGLNVVATGPLYWVYISTSSTLLSAFHKVSSGVTDPTNPEGDFNVLFGTYWYLAQDICYLE